MVCDALVAARDSASVADSFASVAPSARSSRELGHGAGSGMCWLTRPVPNGLPVQGSTAGSELAALPDGVPPAGGSKILRGVTDMIDLPEIDSEFRLPSTVSGIGAYQRGRSMAENTAHIGARWRQAASSVSRLDGYLEGLPVEPDLPTDNPSEISALVCELSALRQHWAGSADLERGHRVGITSVIVEHSRIGADTCGTRERRCLSDDLAHEVDPVERWRALNEFRLAGSAAARFVVTATAQPVRVTLRPGTALGGTHVGQRSAQPGQRLSSATRTASGHQERRSCRRWCNPRAWPRSGAAEGR